METAWSPIAVQSAQRESNPHFRHGKAAGSRYIMGADKSKGIGTPNTTETLARRELNPRPASYKDAALTAELRASE